MNAKSNRIPQESIEELRTLLRSPLSAQESAEILADAVKIARDQDLRFESALRPVVEKSIYNAVREHPKVFSESIFPIILPAIKRSIRSLIQSMVDQLEGIIEKSLSLRSIQWRVEAFRTGRAYAEIALLRSMRYKIQDIFLIHRKTGLLLLHASSHAEELVEEEAFASLITTIQDTFQNVSNQEGGLTRLDVGSRVIWIEQGPEVILAIAVEGPIPEGFQELISLTLSQVHSESAYDLLHFSGDPSSFFKI